MVLESLDDFCKPHGSRSRHSTENITRERLNGTGTYSGHGDMAQPVWKARPRKTSSIHKTTVPCGVLAALLGAQIPVHTNKQEGHLPGSKYLSLALATRKEGLAQI
jgi:hypothetical protein